MSELLSPAEVQPADESISMLKAGLNQVLLDQGQRGRPGGDRDARARARAARGPARPRQDRAVQGPRAAARRCRSSASSSRPTCCPATSPAPTCSRARPPRASSSAPGPLFASIVLADEINRSSPKTQSALLEAMQERSVTVLGTTHSLPDALLRARHPEPHRARGHLPAARGAARPLPVPRRRCRRVGARTLRHPAHPARARRRRRELKPVLDARRPRAALRRGRPGAPAPAGGRLHRPAGRGHPPATRRAPPTRCGASSATAPLPAPRSPSPPAARAGALAKGKPNVGFDEVKELRRAGAQPPPGALLRGRAGEGGAVGRGERAARQGPRGAACLSCSPPRWWPCCRTARPTTTRRRPASSRGGGARLPLGRAGPDGELLLRPAEPHRRGRRPDPRLGRRRRAHTPRRASTRCACTSTTPRGRARRCGCRSSRATRARTPSPARWS